MSEAALRPRPAGSDDPAGFAAAQQLRASDPRQTAWVDASAGSGKTRTLVSRVLRLLLTGCEPHRLLCLTYTKAAAANMALRLNETLADWTTKPEPELASDLRTLTQAEPDDETLRAARQLFARMLDAPGGMQFQTIHSFCQSLLGRFPLEAGVPVGFQVLDDRAARHLLATARADVLHHASTHPGDLLDLALDRLLRDFGPDGFGSLEQSIIDQRARLEPVLVQGAGPAIIRLRRLLDLPEEASEDRLQKAFCAAGTRGEEEWRRLLPLLLQAGGKTMPKMGAVLDRWLALPDPASRAGMIDDYLNLFLTAAGEPRKDPLTREIVTASPQAPDLFNREAEACRTYLDQRSAIRTFHTSAAYITCAQALLGRYDDLKRQRLALDFDDLIDRATALVSAPDAAPWVLYKLDGGIEHVLVDEAQDTNPKQWQLLLALAGEFYTGESRHPARPSRTLFAVGDFKQSIFSFQGARPDAFARAKQDVRTLVQQAGQDFRDTQFKVSFRTLPAILAAVDQTFATAPAHAGLPEYQEGAFAHISRFAGLPGRVEVWPPAPGSREDTAAGWRLPDTRTTLDVPARRLAEAVAAQIRHWIDSGEPLPARGRSMRYGDVMVLVRTRGTFAPELIRACKQRGVPVSGADRMILREQLAVEDLLAFAGFLLLPEDDLTLACVLRGPLVGVDEDTLFTLAHGRPGSLLQRLGRHEPTRSIAAWLAGWLKEADRITPYTLLARLLARPCPASPDSGRRALLRRLGPEAADAIDELLSLTLTFEQQETPTLQGFVRWMLQDASEIKREMEQAGGQVRIMTVHGAKGLEAPVVILADPRMAPTDRNRVLIDPDGLAPPLLAPAREDEALPARLRRTRLRAAELEEYHRLLYVALTRAEDRLIVASWLRRNQDKPSDTEAKTPGWYDLVTRGLMQLTQPQPMTLCPPGLDAETGWQGDGLIHADALQPDLPLRSEKDQPATSARSAVTLPGWVLQPPAPELHPARPLTPSRPDGDDEETVLSPLGEDQSGRWQRGLLIHRLLQTLPDLPPDQRRAAGLRFLHELPAPQARATLDEVMQVIEGGSFAHLFGPGSKAEVPVTGLIGSRVMAGQIDRLMVTADTVYIVDFKTNRPPARTLEEVPQGYLRQLAAYRAALQPVYPSHRIETLLLWTNIPRLMLIPSASLDAAQP